MENSKSPRKFGRFDTSGSPVALFVAEISCALDGVKNVTDEPTNKAFLGVGLRREWVNRRCGEKQRSRKNVFQENHEVLGNLWGIWGRIIIMKPVFFLHFTNISDNITKAYYC